jgi:hypothetical protein
MEPLVCLLLNIAVNIETSEKGDSGKMAQRWMQAGNKMQVPKEASRYHQEDFSFKGGSTLIPLESLNFLAFLQSRGRDFF